MTDRADNFNRADSTFSLGSPSDGGSAWVVYSGVWGINGNRAYKDSATVISQAVALECGSSAGAAEVTVPVVGNCGLIARGANDSNYILAQVLSGTQVALWKKVGGSFTQLGTTLTTTVPAGALVKLEITAGNVITLYVGGVSRRTATDAALSSNTQWGLFGRDTTPRFEDFSFADAAGGGDASVSLSGVAASPGVGTVSGVGGAVVALAGVGASPVVGVVTATAGANATVALDGVAAAPSVGSVTALGGALAALTGVAASPAVGVVAAVAGGNALISLTGVSATPGVGVVTATGGAVRALLGVGAAPGVGVVTVDLAGNAQVLLGGVSAAALIGTVSAAAGASVSIFGVGALPGVGVITVSLIEPGVADGSAAPRIVFAPARLDRVDAGEGRRVVSVN